MKSLKLLLLGFICFLVVSSFVLVNWGKPLSKQMFADGSTVEIKAISIGKLHRIHQGSVWQKLAFRILGTRLPQKYVGYEERWTSYQSIESIAVLTSTVGKDGSGRGNFPWIVLVSTNGMTFHGMDVAATLRGRMGGSGLLHNGSGELIWEFPFLKEEVLKFRYYLSGDSTNFVEITIPNPKPI